MADSIPLYKPYFTQAEANTAAQVILSGNIGGGGPIAARVQQYMQDRFQVKHALLTTSCTHAMELGLMAFDLKPGDEVILPSFTFTSSATCILRQGARPVFAEIDEDTFNLDVEDVAARITPRLPGSPSMQLAATGASTKSYDALGAAIRPGFSVSLRIVIPSPCAGNIKAQSPSRPLVPSMRSSTTRGLEAGS